uniref:Uncharacterized protein n=1 Tax=Archaeoglobus fulgidus TaxID=2234 RepID=A0A7J3M0R4_ARCFL
MPVSKLSKHSLSPAKFDEIIGKEESDSMNSYQRNLKSLKGLMVVEMNDREEQKLKLPTIPNACYAKFCG